MKVLISGGGTGGHIFPALSIANAIKRRYPQAQFLFVGAENRMEMERVPAAGYEIVGLPVAGFDRKRLWRNFGVLWKLFKSMRMARRIVSDFAPDIVIGVGGYASGPTLKAAQRKGVPTLIQEQNQYPGVTNKLLAKGARAICVAYDHMDRFFPADKIVKTGNPVRASLLGCALTAAEARKELGLDPEKFTILAVGGSLGARTINSAVEALLPSLAGMHAQVLWQTGKYYAEECRAVAEGKEGVRAQAFISDMAEAYRAADIVVSRAGAGTISELQLLGKPSILIPSPMVAEDHQRKNAQALVDAGAAVMILDADAVEKLPAEVEALLSAPERIADLGRNIARMALPEADERIVDEIENILKK